MNISLLEPIGISEADLLIMKEKYIKEEHTFTYYKTKTTDIEMLKERCKGQDIIIVANNPLPNEVIDSCVNLKMIAVAFTGIDHIGMDACKNKGILVCNAAGYSDQTVAELIIGMAINAYRNIQKSSYDLRQGGTAVGIGGKEISGKTVGIIGLGRIGLKTAHLFSAFGANVKAFNRSKKESVMEMGIEYVSLEELLKESDIISLNMPLNNETRGFIGKREIELMRSDALFIN